VEKLSLGDTSRFNSPVHQNDALGEKRGLTLSADGILWRKGSRQETLTGFLISTNWCKMHQLVKRRKVNQLLKK